MSIIAAILIATSLPIAQSAPVDVRTTSKFVVPDDIAGKVSALPQDKQDFITSGEFKKFIKAATMVDRLRKRTPAQIEELISAMQLIKQQSVYDANRDEPAIPLNTHDESFNAWKVLRPLALSNLREPGVITLSRYMYTPSGIPTFASLPVAITPEDLTASKIDIAIVGAPLDMGSGERGARGGPLSLRITGGAGGSEMTTLVAPKTELNMADYGDIAIDEQSVHRSVAHVREVVREIAATGALPFIVGGDHSLAFPDVAALTDIHGKKSIRVIHFDAHYDAASENAGHLLSHSQPVYRLITEGYVNASDYIQVGLHGSWPGEAGFRWMREVGLKYHTVAEIERSGWPRVVGEIIKEARESSKKVFVSFDVDVLDPAFTPGTGTPVAGGLTIREVLPLMRRICSETEVVGFEIVEINPLRDPTYVTALNSNFVMNACIAGIALRKKGIRASDFASPLSISDN